MNTSSTIDILIHAYESKTLLAITISERNEAGVPKLRLLPGQMLKTLNGEEVEGRTDINIQCQAKPRETNPVGTVFEITVLEQLRRNGVNYYNCGNNKVIPK